MSHEIYNNDFYVPCEIGGNKYMGNWFYVPDFGKIGLKFVCFVLLRSYIVS